MAGRIVVRAEAGEEDPVKHYIPMTGLAAPPQGVKAHVDLLVDRPDLGHGMQTQIRAGDVIPPALADFPRRPANGENRVGGRAKTSRPSTPAKSRAQQPRKR